MTEPTIARIWRGRTRPERADEYERYNDEVGVKPLIDKALGVQALRRDGDTETEFMTISYWADVAAMAGFTSADPYAVHHLERDPEFLIELPDHVEVFEIRAAHGTAAPRAGSSSAGGTPPDEDLTGLSHAELVAEVIRLREGFRRYRDSSGPDL